MREPTAVPGVERDGGVYGGWLCGYIRAPYAALVAAFGEPNIDSDGYKTSTEWGLVLADGTEFRLYDYKETDLYSDDLPTVEEFRARPHHDWHIGGPYRDGSSEVRRIKRAVLDAVRGANDALMARLAALRKDSSG